MNRFILVIFILIPLPLFAQLEVGGDLLDNCADIDGYVQDGDFPAARDAAQRCMDGIENQLTDEVSSYFYEEIGDWTLSNIEQTQAMGFTNIAAVYVNGGNSVNVSLTGTPGGNSGIGGFLGGIAQSAFGSTGTSVTVAGIPSTLSSDGSLMVPLENGYFLSFDSPNFNNADQALDGMGDLINDFPVADINNAVM